MRRLMILVLVASATFGQEPPPAREAAAGVEYQDLGVDALTQFHAIGIWNSGAAARQQGRTAIVLRASHGERGESEDQQVDLELWPRFGPRSYAYFSGAMSTESSIYPEWRVGGEYFQGFGKGFEASAGYRHLAFADPADIFTASLGRYAGNWYLLGRAYLSDNEWAPQFLARRYFGDEGSYLGIRTGTAREEIRSGADLVALEETEAAVEARYVSPVRWTITGRAGVTGVGEDEGFTGALTLGWRY